MFFCTYNHLDPAAGRLVVNGKKSVQTAEEPAFNGRLVRGQETKTMFEGPTSYYYFVAHVIPHVDQTEMGLNRS